MTLRLEDIVITESVGISRIELPNNKHKAHARQTYNCVYNKPPPVDMDKNKAFKSHQKLKAEEQTAEQEHLGDLRFEKIRPGSSVLREGAQLVTLLQLQDIITRALPSMPGDHISHLLFDVNHRSVACIKNGCVAGVDTHQVEHRNTRHIHKKIGSYICA